MIYPNVHSYTYYELPNETFVNVTFSAYEITEDESVEMTAEFSLNEDQLKEILEKINKLKGVK